MDPSQSQRPGSRLPAYTVSRGQSNEIQFPAIQSPLLPLHWRSLYVEIEEPWLMHNTNLLQRNEGLWPFTHCVDCYFALAWTGVFPRCILCGCKQKRKSIALGYGAKAIWNENIWIHKIYSKVLFNFLSLTLHREPKNEAVSSPGNRRLTEVPSGVSSNPTLSLSLSLSCAKEIS